MCCVWDAAFSILLAPSATASLDFPVIPHSFMTESLHASGCWKSGRFKMTQITGQYVRMVVSPKTRMGTIKAVRFDGDRIHILLHQDPRLTFQAHDVWLLNSDVTDCERPTDEQMAIINYCEKSP
jgi:hypothetical protein